MNAGEMRKNGHMEVGGRFDVRDSTVIDQFHRAFRFWEDLLDARFYDDESSSCSIAVVAATTDILGDEFHCLDCNRPRCRQQVI
jgi:hypothetical protein